MLHVDMATVKGAKASDRKSLAILAYDNATADPAGANWRAVADILRLAIPNTKAKAAEIATDSRFAPWADYDVNKISAKRLGKSPILVVTFADGEIVRTGAVSMPGKAVNIGRGLRIALAFYQCRISRRMGFFSDDSAIVNVPEFVSISCETTGDEFDVADCNARTAELRAGSFNLATATADAAILPEHDRFSHVVLAFKAARHALRHPDGATEYNEADRAALRVWDLSNPGMVAAINSRTGDEFITGERSARLAYAVMTFWPDCSAEAFAAELAAPAEIAAPVAEIPAPAEMTAPIPVAPAEIAAAVPSPVAPSFKVPRRFLGSSRMVRIGPPLLVAPSCILRVAA